MPQMSPMLWFNLYIYFLLILILSMLMFYYLEMFMSNKLSQFKNFIYNYKIKW